jgi:hypothetical protein
VSLHESELDRLGQAVEAAGADLDQARSLCDSSLAAYTTAHDAPDLDQARSLCADAIAAHNTAHVAHEAAFAAYEAAVAAYDLEETKAKGGA